MRKSGIPSALFACALLLFLPWRPTTAPAQVTPGTMTPEEEKAADMRMPDIDRSGLLPKLRQPVEVGAEERNPFAVATKAFERITGVVTDTERDRIEKLLRALRISGVSESASGRRVLMGPLSLGEGQEVPTLFADQVDRLVVKSITDREVVLEFLNSDSTKRGRPLSLPIDLESGSGTVRSLLVGEAFRKVVPMDEDGTVTLPPLQSPGVQAVVQGAEAQELKGLVERPTELLDAPAEVSSNEVAEP